MEFGAYIRAERMRLQETDRAFSLRQVADRVGIKPTYLSKIERGELPPPSEATILRLADELALDGDVILAMASKVSAELRAIICDRPQLFSTLLRELKELPDHAVLTLIRETTDGNW
jgi:transcriptional regulator with XRE-family HTH domain